MVFNLHSCLIHNILIVPSKIHSVITLMIHINHIERPTIYRQILINLKYNYHGMKIPKLQNCAPKPS